MPMAIPMVVLAATLALFALLITEDTYKGKK